MPTTIFAMLEMFLITFTAGKLISFAGMVVSNVGITALEAGMPGSQTGKPSLKAGMVILGRNENIFF